MYTVYCIVFCTLTNFLVLEIGRKDLEGRSVRVLPYMVVGWTAYGAEGEVEGVEGAKSPS